MSDLGKVSGKVSCLYLWYQRRNPSSRSYHDHILIPTFCLKRPQTPQFLISGALSLDILSPPPSHPPCYALGNPTNVTWLKAMSPFHFPAFSTFSGALEASTSCPVACFQRKKPLHQHIFLGLWECIAVHNIQVWYLTFNHAT